MKKYFHQKLFFILLLSFNIQHSTFNISYAQSESGYNLTIKIKGLKDTVCFLANYYGEQQYVKETSQKNVKGGKYIFSGKDTLPTGIYIIANSKKQPLFEFIITSNEQNLIIETDTINYMGNMKIQNSIDNILFRDYRTYLSLLQAKAQPLQTILTALNKSNPKSDSVELISKKITKINTDFKEYRNKIIKENPTTFFATILKVQSDVEVPEIPVLSNGRKDSTFAFRYTKTHFFDDLNLSDVRLLRTPFYQSKLNYYFTYLVPSEPDSAIKESDRIIEKSRGTRETFQYVVIYIFNKYNKSKAMGMDAVYVSLSDKYYSIGQAFWLDSAKTKEITDRAKKLSPTLIGKQAPPLHLQDTADGWYELYKVKSKWTILYFWDSGCSHCKHATPILLDVYHKFKDKGVEVYAVGLEFGSKDWVKYIQDKKLDWINVSDNGRSKFANNFRTIYDTALTPVIFILDENKKILAKQLDIGQVEDYLKMLLGEK